MWFFLDLLKRQSCSYCAICCSRISSMYFSFYYHL